jgi:hypothetical protein
MSVDGGTAVQLPSTTDGTGAKSNFQVKLRFTIHFTPYFSRSIFEYH